MTEMHDPSDTVREVLRDGGDTTLPSLTRDELHALGDEPQLVHGGDALWWEELDEAARVLVIGTARRSLIARNLLTAWPDVAEFVVDPSVQVVLRARRMPSWLMVMREPETSQDTWLVASGIDLAASGTDAMLLSARIEGIYAHRLTSIDIGMETILGWLLGAPAEGKPYVGRTVEAIRPRDLGVRESVADARLIVMTGAQAVHVSDLDEAGAIGPAKQTTPDALRERLAGLVLSAEAASA